jgi:protein-S-isoprenylcysteine O-methyltransferase Ste14
MKMHANTDVIRDQAQVQAPSVDWREARWWAEGKLNRERVKSGAVVVAGVVTFLGLLGVVQYALYQMVQNWSVTGPAASVFGFL